MADLTASFFEAVESGNLDRIREMLAAQPSLAAARDPRGATALHHAAFNDHRDVVRLLHEHGADLNARDAVHDATPAGWAIHYLRELGGLLSIEIEDALHAIDTGDVPWATRLVRRHPALVTAVDARGTPLADHARASGVQEIAALFDDRTSA